jgi:hypothetical protein
LPNNYFNPSKPGKPIVRIQVSVDPAGDHTVEKWHKEEVKDHSYTLQIYGDKTKGVSMSLVVNSAELDDY